MMIPEEARAELRQMQVAMPRDLFVDEIWRRRSIEHPGHVIDGIRSNASFPVSILRTRDATDHAKGEVNVHKLPAKLRRSQ